VDRSLSLYLPFDEPARLARWRRLRTGAHNAGRMRARIRDLRPDVIFVWSQLRLSLGSARAAEASGVPVAYTLNDDHLRGYAAAPVTASPRGLGRLLADRMLMRRATLSSLRLENVTVISRCLQDELARQGVSLPHARVIYQGVPVERFPVRERPGSTHSPARLLYVGQLHDYKGVDTLVRAAHRLAQHHPDLPFELSLVGDGSPAYRRHLEGLIAEGPAQIELAGRRPHEELPREYRRHDVFVFPSRWKEPFGLTHLEAMASGLSVVSTANGGQGEFLSDGDNALVVPPGDESRLAEGLARLLRDEGLRCRLALRGRSTVEERFTLDRYVGELELFLAEVATGERRVA
jgi:glycosyltransferase involved in cell wall biosynthesis